MKGPREPGRKDKHNKVQTAKGQRDRRLRLSAHTAIQFYDVQDRLGYDQPSKALDWLIVKAKKAIDKINELPQWQPSTIMNTTSSDLPVVNQHLEDPKYGFVNANQSLFPGEIFPGIACLNGSGNMYDQNICGLVMNAQEMPQQVVFSQSNLAVDDWNERMPKAAMDQGAVSCSSSDFSCHFELGFGAQARIGEEDDQSEIHH